MVFWRKRYILVCARVSQVVISFWGRKWTKMSTLWPSLFPFSSRINSRLFLKFEVVAWGLLQTTVVSHWRNLTISDEFPQCQNFGQTLNSERHHISCSHGRAMECLSWVNREKLTGEYREYIIIRYRSVNIIRSFTSMIFFSNRRFLYGCVWLY